MVQQTQIRRRKRPVMRHSGSAIQPTSPLATYWVAQVLLIPAVWKRGWCVHEKHFDHESLLQCLGLKQSVEGKLRQPPKALNAFIEQHSLERLLSQDDTYANLDRLGNRLGLAEAEKRLLTFISHLHASALLYQAGELMPECSHQALVTWLAALLQCPKSAVHDALRPEGVLRAARLLQLDITNNRRGDITGVLQLEYELTEMLQTPQVSDETLISLFFRPAEAPSLTLADFIEMSDEVGLLKTLLRNTMEKQLRGINILLYGPPGTGKTQLALLLAQELGYPMATIPENDKDGDAIHAVRRLGRYNACQRVLKHDRNTLVMFDEAEDVLCDGPSFFLFSAPRETPKPGVIRTLENNTRPTIWISNRADMDAAFMRRFTHVVKIDNPGLHQRQRLVAQALEGAPVSSDFIQQAARLETLSPATLHAGLKFAQLASDKPQDVEALLAHNLNARLEAQDETSRLHLGGLTELPWRAECLRASEDVASLLHEINANLPVRFCLYGAPGTGKTAWAKQLAEHLGKPLVLKQASDLLGKFVGETEKKIARAFSQAEQQKAVLLIDEADSFLGSRQQAHHSWEVSQVNQFLTSMENYRGIFIATTNLLDRVDEAAMRRFDFTIAFDYLDSNGVITLLKDLATAHNIALPDDKGLRMLLDGMNQLTPGDFAALHRRLQVRNRKPDAKRVVELLAEMQVRKNKESRPIGFSAKLH